jgi:hypothetical protein
MAQCTLVASPWQPAAVVDPTGCGDAWRGALLFGSGAGLAALARCAELGNRVGALKIAAAWPTELRPGFHPRVMGALWPPDLPSKSGALDTVLKALPVGHKKTRCRAPGWAWNLPQGLVPVGKGQAAWGFSVV